MCMEADIDQTQQLTRQCSKPAPSSKATVRDAGDDQNRPPFDTTTQTLKHGYIHTAACGCNANKQPLLSRQVQTTLLLQQTAETVQSLLSKG